MTEPTHAHSFVAGSDAGRAPLVLLHGSGGGEGDLMELGEELAPRAVGFSNGAIMAAALLLMRPGLLAGTVLFRPLSAFGYAARG